MAAPKSNSKKRKVTEEGRVFNPEWTRDYFFIEEQGKPVCLICKRGISVMKLNNITRHYNTSHRAEYRQLHGDARKQRIDKLMKTMKQQQECFFWPPAKDKPLLAKPYCLTKNCREMQTLF
ncbi:General transcription factor II-I repeat domain-containing protein 2 [Holothuria leucospilota]|uniref:General transcription factor II-I repeat domain-containing protein 2 n=1 Tax=Holothuria leucospilota TaxID=206669 RepID=A0A9Q1BHX3_HOLLE|nr:General transcription factor II-I repeat domain-containing protein 2 [Holothuria leucospilota]